MRTHVRRVERIVIPALATALFVCAALRGHASVSPPAYTFSTIMDGGFAREGVGTDARFLNPVGIAVDASGTVYVVDYRAQWVSTISPTGVVSTLAGLIGVAGTADGTGAAARFVSPFGVAVDNAGTIYVTTRFAR
jgi:hypothetical protein